MLRRCARRLARVGPKVKSEHRPPHAILGVAADATEDQLKEAYHKLARTLHPDMPNGDAKRFKEVNAAYNLLKAQRAKGLRGEPGDGTDPDGAGEEDPLAQRMAEHMRRYHEERERGRPKTNSEMMWDDDVYEMLLIVAPWFIAATFIIDRAIARRESMQEHELARTAAVSRASEYRAASAAAATTSGAASPFQGVGSSGMRHQVEVKDPSPEGEGITEASQAAYLKRQRRAQQNYSDLREYFLIHDTDFVTDRRFNLAKISTDRIDESRIPENCALVKRINTTSNPKAYDGSVREIVDEIARTEWRYVDAGPTTALTLDALRWIPKHSPADARVTFVEYQSDQEAAPRCMVAVINDRWMPGTGKTQRAVVSGKESFHPRAAILRAKQLRTGEFKVEDAVLPGWVPVSDKRA